MADKASCDDLTATTRVIEAGHVKVHVTDTVPLAQVQRGFERHGVPGLGRTVILTQPGSARRS